MNETSMLNIQETRVDFHSHSFAARFLQASLQSARALILTRRDNMIDAS